MFEATIVTVKKSARKTAQVATDLVKIHDEDVRGLTYGWIAGVGIGTGISIVALGAVKLAHMALTQED